MQIEKLHKQLETARAHLAEHEEKAKATEGLNARLANRLNSERACRVIRKTIAGLEAQIAEATPPPAKKPKPSKVAGPETPVES